MTEAAQLLGTSLVRFRLPNAPGGLPFHEAAGLLADLDAVYACVMLGTQAGYERMPGVRLGRDASTELLAPIDQPGVYRLRYGSEWAVVIAEGVPWAAIGATIAAAIKYGSTAVQLPGMMRQRDAQTDTERANARLRNAEAARKELENQAIERRIEAFDSGFVQFVSGDDVEDNFGILGYGVQLEGPPQEPPLPGVVTQRREAVIRRQESVSSRLRARRGEPGLPPLLHLNAEEEEPFDELPPTPVLREAKPAVTARPNPGVSRALNAIVRRLRERIRRFDGMAVEVEE